MSLLKYHEYTSNFQRDIIGLIKEEISAEIEDVSQIIDICKEYEDWGMGFEFDLGLAGSSVSKVLEYTTGSKLSVPEEIIRSDVYLKRLFNKGNLILCLRLKSMDGVNRIDSRLKKDGKSVLGEFMNFGERVIAEFPELGLKFNDHFSQVGPSHYFYGRFKRR